MDFKIMWMTFGMVFLAELGDKTQLATFCLSADCVPKFSVFAGIFFLVAGVWTLVSAFRVTAT